MVETSLVGPNSSTGEDILRALDQAKIPVQAAFWTYLQTASRWRLYIASPVVDEDGPTGAYLKLQRAIKRVRPTDAAELLLDITVISPRDRIAQAIRRSVKTGPGIHHEWVDSSVLDAQFFDNALVYRST